MWSLHYNYVSPMYHSLCRFLPGTTLHTILEQNIKIHNSHCCCAHTLHTHMHARTHLSSYIHVHTHALIKGVLNQGQSPHAHPCYKLTYYTHAHTHTINITTATVFLRPPSAISQSSQAPSSWNNLHALLQQNIEVCTHTHTQQPLCMHARMHAHTSHSTFTNQGCTEPGAEPPTYTLATCSPTTHTHTHTLPLQRSSSVTAS